MNLSRLPFVLICSSLLAVPAIPAQDAASLTTASVVPRLVRYSGAAPNAPSGASVVELRFATYETQSGGEPLWQETQQVPLDANGKYSVLLGVATPGGMPLALFAGGGARWLGVTLAGGQESARTPLAAAPYALKASDAETLGGHPATDFALKNTTPLAAMPETATPVTQINVSSGILGGGTGPTVALSLDGAYLGTLGNSLYAQLNAANAFKKTQTLATLGAATASKGFNSNALKFGASAYNMTAGAAEALNFTWQAEPVGNDTAAPSANMALLFNTGTNAPAETGFKIASNGKLTFASGQTFPGAGTGTITGVTAGTDLTGGGTSGAVTLNLNTAALQTANDARYAQLNGSPTFSYVTVTNQLSAAAVSVNTGNNVAASFINDSDFDPPLSLEADNIDGPLFESFNGASGAQCNIDQDANLACTGSVTGSNAVQNGRRVQTYAMQSAENWIEDFGSAKLANGRATVAIDPAFDDVVNTSVEYHVYLTPEGESEGLYVSAKGPRSFEVRESHGGTSSIAFDYRIVAKHKGTEKVRLADITEKMKRMTPVHASSLK